MKPFDSQSPIGILGAGTMGAGIAQIAASAGHPVTLYDTSQRALAKAREGLEKILERLAEKGKVDRNEMKAVLDRIRFTPTIDELKRSQLVIEAIVEDLSMKRAAFRSVEKLVSGESVMATNTSSLSITSIASACRQPQRALGLHFFNPAPLMPLVEVVPGLLTSPETVANCTELVREWGKTTVAAKDTPGFIVNRVARPFYGEALRLLEEGVADAATIDWAMRTIGGFRMGPFELMDLIGNDVNYTATETVFREFFHDPRFRPSITQKRMVEAGLLGRKTGRGFYNYKGDAERPRPKEDRELGKAIFFRILVMLINEAVDALLLQVASASDIDLAMTKGVNYPKGLLRWGDEIGPEKVLKRLQELHAEYGDDRYRPNPLLRRAVAENRRFCDG